MSAPPSEPRSGFTAPVSDQSLEQRLSQLQERGVVLVDPRQVWLAEDVVLERIHAGSILYPGTRIQGARSWIGPQAEVGKEGPATIINAQLDRDTRIDSGFVSGSVLLQGATLGANAHVRPGCLLEEQVSTAHCVGLKQTILLSFVTLGSLINFCDCLMAGGSSRRNHAEVGSGYIHFNFTPWGASGDKATPSLIGEVPHGVFLRQDRIFLGGSGGMVGPRTVGYGSVVAAGQVLRQDVIDHRLVLNPPKMVDRPCQFSRLDRIESRATKNVDYIANLVALRSWYQEVRLHHAGQPESTSIAVLEGAMVVLNTAISERHRQLQKFLEERGKNLRAIPNFELPKCPTSLQSSETKPTHLDLIKSLTQTQIDQGTAWLQAILANVQDAYAEKLS